MNYINFINRTKALAAGSFIQGKQGREIKASVIFPMPRSSIHQCLDEK